MQPAERGHDEETHWPLLAFLALFRGPVGLPYPVTGDDSRHVRLRDLRCESTIHGDVRDRSRVRGHSAIRGQTRRAGSRHPCAMLTARATTTARVANESRCSTLIANFARRVYGIASVGENAIEAVSER